MTADELRELTTIWFTADPQDMPEISVVGAGGRYGAVFDFFRRYGGAIRPGGSFWDPIAERDVPLESVANPGAAADAGRAGSFVAEFEGIGFNGIKLPSLMVWPDPPDGLQIFWECGPQWDRADLVAAFFDLLAAFEEQLEVRLEFEDDSGSEPAGPRLGNVYALWVARSDADEQAAMLKQIRGFREMVDLPVTDEVVDRLVELGFGGTAVPGMWELPDESARREQREAEIEAATERLQAHVAEHRAAYAGCWREWQAGVPTLIVAFVGDHDTHEQAVAATGIRVVAVRHPIDELRRIADEILTREEVPARGTELNDVRVDVPENVVDVVARGADEARLRATLAERHGDAVRLTWEMGDATAC